MLFAWIKDMFRRLFAPHGIAMDNLNVEVPTVHTRAELEAMTKVQIDEYGEKFGLKLDRRWAKKRMINELFANGLIRED